MFCKNFMPIETVFFFWFGLSVCFGSFGKRAKGKGGERAIKEKSNMVISMRGWNRYPFGPFGPACELKLPNQAPPEYGK